MLLIYILIIIFIFLLTYTFFSQQETNKIIEGLENTQSVKKEYQPYNLNDPNNALILAQQNAGNITFLKQRLDTLTGINQQVQDLSGNVQSLQTQVNGLVQAQQDYANQMTGGTAPEVTGATEDSEPNSSTSNYATE